MFFYMSPALKKLRGSYILLSGCAFVVLFDAWHILWTMHARVLKFHIWISHGKIAEQYFFPVNFLSKLSPFLELRPL